MFRTAGKATVEGRGGEEGKGRDVPLRMEGKGGGGGWDSYLL